MLILITLLGFLTLGLGLVAPSLFPLVQGQTAPGWLAALAILPLAGLLFLLFSLWQGRPARLLLWLFPEIRGLQALAVQSVWARAFGTLLGAGLPVPEALQASLSIVTDGQLRAAMAQALESARAGASLETALARCGLEPSLIWCLEGEDVAVRVLDGADALEREIQMRADLQLKLMVPRALFFLGILSSLALLTFWWPFVS